MSINCCDFNFEFEVAKHDGIKPFFKNPSFLKDGFKLLLQIIHVLHMNLQLDNTHSVKKIAVDKIETFGHQRHPKTENR